MASKNTPPPSIDKLYTTVKLNKNLLSKWIDSNSNVMLIGKKGCGKSAIITTAFQEHFKDRWVYFAGSTIDPWTQLVGVPVKKETDKGDILDYILPKGIDDTLEAIFIDEYNRSNKRVRNALMEMVQFKSINGRKFPNLKIVWAAVNPPNEDDNEEVAYDVESIDPAQMDRFQIIVNLKYEPDDTYFINKFGDAGRNAIRWWKELDDNGKNLVSPRRLDYVVEGYNKGISVDCMLPVSVNVKSLLKLLSTDSETLVYEAFLADKDTQSFIACVSNKKVWERFKDRLLVDDNSKFFNQINNLPKEDFATYLSKDKQRFCKVVLNHYNDPYYKEVIDTITSTNAEYKTLFDKLSEKIKKKQNNLPLLNNTIISSDGGLDRIDPNIVSNIMVPASHSEEKNIMFLVERVELATYFKRLIKTCDAIECSADISWKPLVDEHYVPCASRILTGNKDFVRWHLGLDTTDKVYHTDQENAFVNYLKVILSIFCKRTPKQHLKDHYCGDFDYTENTVKYNFGYLKRLPDQTLARLYAYVYLAQRLCRETSGIRMTIGDYFNDNSLDISGELPVIIKGRVKVNDDAIMGKVAKSMMSTLVDDELLDDDGDPF